MKLNLVDNLNVAVAELMETDGSASAVKSDVEPSSKEDVGYNDIQVQNGYSRGTSMTVEVSGNSSVDLDVDIKMKLMTKEAIRKLINFATKECHDVNAKETLKNINDGEAAGGFLWFFSASDKNKNDYHNTTRKADMNDKDFQNKFSKEIADGEEGDYIVKGKITVTSTSFVKTRTALFLEITKFTVKKEDDKTVTKTMVSQNAVAADEQGNVNPDIKAKGKLNIIPQ